jgi:triosephosphate isomerase (TIM)
MKRHIVGNWKMNLELPEALVLAQEVAGFAGDYPTLQITIAPSLPWLVSIKEALTFMPTNFALASQVVSPHPHGAYTGDVSATQLKPLVRYCLVGHSERRRFHHEDSQAIQSQITELCKVGITPIVCFGESKQSSSPSMVNQVLQALKRDLASLQPEVGEKCLFAYEPLWAIGTGHPATADYTTKMATAFKAWAKQAFTHDAPLLYGGSVTTANAAALGSIKVIDGLLVGGVSLHGREFKTICAHYSQRV